jgi:hypothetical protein
MATTTRVFEGVPFKSRIVIEFPFAVFRVKPFP